MNLLKELTISQKKKLLVSLIILLTIFGIAGYRKFTNQPKELIAGSLLPDVTDAKKLSEKELKQLADKKVDETKFTLTIYPEAYFDSGDSEGKLYIKNEPNNYYPIAVQLFEDDSKELLYDSGAIHPGYEIETISLNKTLAKGTHKATAKVSIFNPKTKQYQGQTEAAVNINVKN